MACTSFVITIMWRGNAILAKYRSDLLLHLSAELLAKFREAILDVCMPPHRRNSAVTLPILCMLTRQVRLSHK